MSRFIRYLKFFRNFAAANSRRAGFTMLSERL
jgi:hypothetical protein